MTPKSNNGGPHEKPTTTKSPGHAGVLQAKGMPTQKPPRPALVLPEPHCSAMVRALKASAKNAGLIPLTPPHGHSNLKVEPQTKTTATWRASAKQATPRSAASQHSENSSTTSGILADIVVSLWSCFASSTGLPVLLFSLAHTPVSTDLCSRSTSRYQHQCSRHGCFHYQSNVFRNGFNLKATTQVTDARYVC